MVGRREGKHLWFYEAQNCHMECKGAEGVREAHQSQLCGWKVDVLCLQEMKLEFISLSIIRSLWNCYQVGWSYFPSKGASRVVEKMDDCVADFTVAKSFKTVANIYQWAFAGVYGPHSNIAR